MSRPKSPSNDPGQQAVDFVNNLTHTGDFNGVPFALRPWQESIVRRLFGTMREDGKRRYRKAFLAFPRKQGKTELAAAMILFLLLGTGKRGQQLYSASGDRDQAALTYRAAAEMIRNDPELESVCLVYDGYKRIVCEPLGSFYQALSSDAPRKHGLRPSAVIFDELHVLPNRDLFNALTTAFGATLEPLTVMITTAGWDRTSLCYEQWKYAEGVRDGLIDDAGFLPVLHQAAPEDDWTSEDTWHKAMPGLGDFCQLDFIRDECKRAQELPAYENTFRQLYLNQWTEQAVRWLSTERWSACGGWFDPAELLDQPCYGGLDLGVTGDMAVYVLLFPDDDGGFHALAHGWVPRDGKWKKEPKNRDRYEAWQRDGYLTFTDGEAIDHQVIEDAIVRWSGKYPLRKALGDRAYACRFRGCPRGR
jgi:phage terminase large subunit-like protein